MRAIVVVVLGLGLALVPACGAETDPEWSTTPEGSDITAAPGGTSPDSTGAEAASNNPASQPVSTEAESITTTTSATVGPAESEGTLSPGYCGALLALMGLERSGGAMAEFDYETRYRTLLQAVIDESPPEHGPTWELFVTMVDEPFTYDNFNPAVDSLERIVVALDAGCPGAELMVVDDDGRITSWLTIDG